MRTWNVVALLLLVGVVVTPLATAQSTDDLRQEVDQLKRDLQQVIERNAEIGRENAELRGKVADIESADSSLESRVNALSETLAVAPATTVHSHANPVTIEGEFRHRAGWVWDRDFNDDVDDDGTFHDGRYRVGLLFEFDRNVATYFSVQANGLFNNGDTPGGNGFNSGFDDDFEFKSAGGIGGPFSSSDSSLDAIALYEGWIDLKNIFGRREFTLRAGRQEIVLGNEFQFGNNDFFSGETFDGLHFMWMAENFDLHFIALKLATATPFNTRNHPYAVGGDGYDDDELYALYFTLKSIEDVDIDLYWIFFNGNLPGSVGTLGNPLNSFGGDFFYHTIGARVAGGFDVAAGLDWNIEVAYQFGDIESGGGDIDVDGLAVEAEIGITFNRNNRFRVFVRVLWAQGSDDSDETGYIPLFPERHAQAGTGGSTNYRARYGLMDIIPMSNVLTAQAGFTFDPRTDWTVGATILWAQLDEEVFIGGDDEEDVGFEVDIFAEYRYSDQTTVSLGAAVFFADEATPLAGTSGFAGDDDDLAIFIYTQIRVIF